MSGFETVQLYTTDMYASISPDNKRLRAFEKTFIESGSFKKIKFKIPVKDLSFFNINNESSFENGDFMISIGPNSKELSSIPFNVN
jgi:beta-glucosidase